MKSFKKQAGFTLVEIAIVLVIVGLLLAGVLKGQELIANSRIKAGGNELASISAANNSYVDRFRRMPGDDGPLATLTARGGQWANVTVGSAPGPNGALVSAGAAVFTPVLESLGFWQHLRAAGFITGSPATIGAAAAPQNAFGGLIGVIGAAAAVTGANGNAVCLSQVPGTAARALDAQLDDGVPDAGGVRATLGAAGVNTNPGAAVAAATGYVDTSVYTVCRTL
ncbi:type II secretion system protein [Polaromonas sp.]|uniref:type II secretion system protein n=1 Tax=Polaromonas sp. TaxID=1869339 RepID=UPI0035667E9D